MKRIIIAEDSESLRKSYILYIEDEVKDIIIDEVDNSSDLIKKVKENDYQLILTDNKMPKGIDGINAIKDIREFNRNIPIYLICGGLYEKKQDLKDNPGKYGINEFIDKEKDEIPSKLNEIINRYLR